ncbi:hypothetical protein ADUPG1_004443, partial [Aduncisulcus paluster]
NGDVFRISGFGWTAGPQNIGFRLISLKKTRSTHCSKTPLCIALPCIHKDPYVNRSTQHSLPMPSLSIPKLPEPCSWCMLGVDDHVQAETS